MAKRKTSSGDDKEPKPKTKTRSRAKPKPPPATRLRMDQIGPNVILNLGYCLYVIDSYESLEVEERRLRIRDQQYRLAKSALDDFFRLEASVESLSHEELFLLKVRLIMLSLARGVRRRKEIQEDRLFTAKQEKEAQVDKVVQAPRKAGFLLGAWKVFLLGGLGFFVMKTVAPQLEMSQESNPTYASMAAAIVTIFAGTWMKSIMLDQQIVRIFDNYEHILIYAEREYKRGAYEEYRRHKEQAVEAWQEFTGVHWKETPGFEQVHLADMELQARFQEERKLRMASPLRKLWLALGGMYTDIRGIQGDAGAPESREERSED